MKVIPLTISNKKLLFQLKKWTMMWMPQQFVSDVEEVTHLATQVYCIFFAGSVADGSVVPMVVSIGVGPFLTSDRIMAGSFL